MPVRRKASGVRGTSALGVLLPLGRPGRRWAVEGLLLGVRLGLAGRLFCVTAHDLLDVNRERRRCWMLTKANVKKASPWHRLAIQTGKERSRPWVCFPRFGGYDFVAYQQVDLIRTVDMLTKKHPAQHGPREGAWEEKALDGPVTAALTRRLEIPNIVTRPVMTSRATTIQLN